MSALAKLRPQQRPCTGTSCRRRFTVAARDIFKVRVPNRNGGSHLDAAWNCPSCRTQNIIPASHLPRGVLQELPMRADQAPAAQPTPPPVWRTGAEGRRLLDDAIAAAAAGRARLAPTVIRAGEPVLATTVDARGRLLPEFAAGAVLDTLDRIDCVALVVTGLGSDHWTTVFDPRSGAASLTR